MWKMSTVIDSKKRPLWRRPGLVLSALVLVGVLGAACATAAAPDGDGVAADAAGGDGDFQITLFGNENHEAGDTLNLTDYAGKPVVLNFWYPSCPPCALEMPDLEAAFKKHKENGVEFIGIMSLILDTVAEGQEFVDDFGITYAIGPDTQGDILVNNKVIGFPTTIFLNEDHEVVRKWTGILNAEKLDELIAEATN
jgi:peroxiredoxin